MKRINMIIPALAFMGLLAGGCVVHGRTGVHAHAHVSAPSLVYVGPEVQVVEDYHEPVFYSEGYYWRYYDGIWFRSHVHTGSWVRVRTVPGAVLRVERPHTYVRYRSRGNVRTYDHRPAPRAHHRSRTYVTPAPSRSHGPAVHHRDSQHVRVRSAPPGHTTTVRHNGNGNAHGHTKVKVKVKEDNGGKTIRVRER